MKRRHIILESETTKTKITVYINSKCIKISHRYLPTSHTSSDTPERWRSMCHKPVLEARGQTAIDRRFRLLLDPQCTDVNLHLLLKSYHATTLQSHRRTKPHFSAYLTLRKLYSIIPKPRVWMVICLSVLILWLTGCLMTRWTAAPHLPFLMKWLRKWREGLN